MCCSLNSVTSTPQWIRQPKPRGCVFVFVCKCVIEHSRATQPPNLRLCLLQHFGILTSHDSLITSTKSKQKLGTTPSSPVLLFITIWSSSSHLTCSRPLPVDPLPVSHCADHDWQKEYVNLRAPIHQIHILHQKKQLYGMLHQKKHSR